MCGALLLVGLGGAERSWHAHSLLSLPEARAEFGTYLLFAAAIDHLGTHPIWWGGQPAGANGAGVFQFKQRFANVSAPAHLLSIDLRPDALAKVRATRTGYAWLPDYRNPLDEMRA